MNAILSLSHFCEIHGPTVLLSTQVFHFAGEGNTGILEPSGIQFFGCIQKLKEHKIGTSPNVDFTTCEACESISGYITNDYQKKISFLSTRLAVDSNVSSLLKQAAVRSLSCEVVPKKEGKVYFGDSARGHVLSTTFFLKDAQARGFHRWYSIVVFMRDKHFLLNSWPFFQKHVNQMIEQLQKKAVEVYSDEQNLCSQRALRLSSMDQKHSIARSLIKLTACTNVFAQLHLWFTWLLSTGAQRLEENLPTRTFDCKLQERQAGGFILVEEVEKTVVDCNGEETILFLRLLRQTLGSHDFQRLLYSTLIGRQVIVRGHKTIVAKILNALKILLPARKFRCQEFGDTYKYPEICNIVGLDFCAAVPKSSDQIMRLDVVPKQEIESFIVENLTETFALHNFLIKSETGLPEKLPTLLLKLDKVLSDESLTDRVVWFQIKSLMEHWIHNAEIIQETKKKQQRQMHLTGLLQCLGIQEQDETLIKFWTS